MIDRTIPMDLSQCGHNTLVNEGLTGYTWGDEKGLGIAEYLHQVGR